MSSKHHTIPRRNPDGSGPDGEGWPDDGWPDDGGPDDALNAPNIALGALIISVPAGFTAVVVFLLSGVGLVASLLLGWATQMGIFWGMIGVGLYVQARRDARDESGQAGHMTDAGDSRHTCTSRR